MSLEQNILNLTSAVTRLADLIEDQGIPAFAKSKLKQFDELPGNTLTNIDVVKIGEVETVTPPEPLKRRGRKPKVEPDAINPIGLSLSLSTPTGNLWNEIVQLVTESQDENETEVIDTLKAFGVARANQLKPEQYADFLKALKAAIANAAPSKEPVSLV